MGAEKHAGKVLTFVGPKGQFLVMLRAVQPETHILQSSNAQVLQLRTRSDDGSEFEIIPHASGREGELAQVHEHPRCTEPAVEIDRWVEARAWEHPIHGREIDLQHLKLQRRPRILVLIVAVVVVVDVHPPDVLPYHLETFERREPREEVEIDEGICRERNRVHTWQEIANPALIPHTITGRVPQHQLLGLRDPLARVLEYEKFDTVAEFRARGHSNEETVPFGERAYADVLEEVRPRGVGDGVVGGREVLEALVAEAPSRPRDVDVDE
jgi:hypothetical protein